MKNIPIIGQEAICPDGLGRVTAYRNSTLGAWIQVATYVNNKESKWAPLNVRLVPIGPTINAEGEDESYHNVTTHLGTK